MALLTTFVTTDNSERAIKSGCLTYRLTFPRLFAAVGDFVGAEAHSQKDCCVKEITALHMLVPFIEAHVERAGLDDELNSSL